MVSNNGRFQKGTLHPQYGKYGPSSIGWKGGVRYSQGYRMVYCPDHPRRHKHTPYVYEHILVYETYYKCCIPRYSAVHHKNENKLDNRIENLEAMIERKHIIMHHRYQRRRTRYGKKVENKICSWCLSDKTNIIKANPNKGRFSDEPQWYSRRHELLCADCYIRLYYLSKYYVCNIAVNGNRRKIYL